MQVVRKAEERRKEEEKRLLQDQRKAKQTREEERVRVEAETNEALVREAPRRARDSFDALRSLGLAYQFVCGQQQHQQVLGESVKAFERLLDILGGGGGILEVGTMSTSTQRHWEWL